MKLIVREPFGKYCRGDEITDSKLIKAILDSDNAAHVIKVAA